MMILTRDEVRELEMVIHEALFGNDLKQGLKTMVATFPTNGLYVGSGVVREFNRYNSQVVDMTSYFNNMKMGDYFDLAGMIRVALENSL